MDWTDEADALLIKLWDEGGSLKYIAEEMTKLGYPLTRNAIAGRKHRLQQRLSRAPGTRATTIVTRPKPKNFQRREPMQGPQRPPTRPVTAQELDALISNKGVEYLKSPGWGCKALLDKRGSDGLPMVCGRPKGLDFNGAPSSYCTTHFRLYHYPDRSRAYG
jgi:hypothetical protein